MTLRCYSRRHLVPSVPLRRQRAFQAYIHSSSRLSATFFESHTIPEDSPTRQSSQITSSSKEAFANLDRRRKEDGGFFSPLLRLGAQQRHPPAEPSDKRLHPLVRKLLNLVYSPSKTLPDQVWQAYNDVYQFSSSDQGSLASQLRPQHHQLVLRALAPDVRKAQLRKREDSRRRFLARASEKAASETASLDSDSTRTVHQLVGNKLIKSSDFVDPFAHGRKSLQEYMKRVNAVFTQMRQSHLLDSSLATSSPTSIAPDISDYNHVLSKLSPGGHVSHMATLWDDLIGVSVRSTSLRSKRSGAAPPMSPNRATYRELMLGLSRHAQDQMERAQKEALARMKEEALKNVSDTERAKKATILNSKFSKETKSLGNLGTKQELAPAARGAAILAAQRTMVLLRDMWDRNVHPDRLTLDLAARSLRLAGDTDGLRALLRAEFGIDLSSPDSEGIETGHPRSPSVHTLNTLLMALGEQATVPEMVVAYETLTRPLPQISDNATAEIIGAETNATEAASEGLFSLKWKDLFTNPGIEQGPAPNPPAAEAGDGHPQVFPYSDPAQIKPNTKTFDILIRHACRAPDPTKSPVALPMALRGRGSVVTIGEDAIKAAQLEVSRVGSATQDERSKRESGRYTMFAKALMLDALEQYERSVEQFGQLLGIALKAQEREAAQPRQDESPESSQPASGTCGATAEPTRPEPVGPHAFPIQALRSDFLPKFDPPSLSIKAETILPYYLLPYRKRNSPELRFLRWYVKRIMSAKLGELRILDGAFRVWSLRTEEARKQARRASAEARGEPIPPEMQVGGEERLAPVPRDLIQEMQRLLKLMKKNYRIKLDELNSLDNMLHDKIEARLKSISEFQRQRRKRRLMKANELKALAQAEEEELARKLKIRKAQVAEARKQRELQMRRQNEEGKVAVEAEGLAAAKSLDPA
ncbi:hypothetical protein IE53DRAFT_333434 [Violaceomyces palustris]|uniref:Uncharacterized protein n=1 Tax=Violaceomyces palustris TaxID=1673888 RepID=A0ACD0NS62_9BASI|nr:hypothetical protein IE53DRAFT_333434 [Violaceomyces palustris]